jgi:hypothetical protein
MVAAAAVAAAAAETLRAALILFCLLRIFIPLERHCASPSSAECHHHHGVSRDYQSSFSEHDKHCNWCGYRLCFIQNLWWANSSIDFFFFPRMVRVNYPATTMKSCVDIAIALRCGGMVEWHRSKASKEDHCCCYWCWLWREVWGLSFMRRMRKEDRRNGTKEQWNP